MAETADLSKSADDASVTAAEQSGVPGAQDLGRRATRGAMWMGLERWIDQAVALGVFVVLSRLLTPREFGVIAAANVVILFMRVVVDQGFSQALVQRSELTDATVDTAFWTAVATGLTFAVFTVAVAPLVASIYGIPQLTTVLRVLALVFLLVALDSTQSALLDREMRFRIQAIRRLCATAASAAVALTIAILGGGVWALVGQALTLEAVTVALLWSMASWRPSWRFDRAAFTELRRWGSQYSLIRILWFLATNGDNFLVGAFLGPVALGYYVVGYRVLVVVNEVLALTATQVVLSAFSKLQHDLEALNRAFCESSLMTGVIALPVYIGLALAARPAVLLVFGTKWAHSVPVMQVLAVAGAVQCQMLFSHNYAIALGRLRAELGWTLVIVTLDVIGFAVAVPFGIVAVAASLGVVNLISWPFRLLRLRSYGGLNLRNYFAPYPPLLAAGAAMAAAMLGVGAVVPSSDWALLLGTQAVAGVSIYVLALHLFSPALARRLRDLVTGLHA